MTIGRTYVPISIDGDLNCISNLDLAEIKVRLLWIKNAYPAAAAPTKVRIF